MLYLKFYVAESFRKGNFVPRIYELSLPESKCQLTLFRTFKGEVSWAFRYLLLKMMN